MKFLTILLLCVTGCATMSLTTPDGYSAAYTRLGDQNIQGFRFERDELGMVRVVLEKQNSNEKVLDAIGALIGAAK